MFRRGQSNLVRNVLDGTEEVICHRGTHQYGERGIFGVSACGLAALNFARVIFEKVRKSVRDEDLLRAVIAKETVQDITDICADWSSDLHVDVDDIYKVPLFDNALQLVSTKYGHPDLDQFTNLLHDLQGIQTHVVVIITRPPEIIACLKLIISNKDVFIIFDSHARPSHPDGAGFILNTSIHRTAVRLNEIMPVNARLLSQTDLQWQAQLLANYSGHIFVSKGPGNDLVRTVIESSLAILACRAEISALKSQNSAVETENKRMQAEVEQMEDQLLEERRKRRELLRNTSTTYRAPSVSVGINNAVAGPSRIIQDPPSRPPAYTLYIDEGSAPESASGGHTGSATREYGDILHEEPMQADSLDPERESAEAAARMQREFDEEDRRLRAEMEELANSAQRLFQCSVCLDEQPEDYIARLDPCGHSFCRDCIRNHVASKIAESRHPIFCPLCMTQSEVGDPGVVTDILVQQIGVTEAEYRTWVELELAQYSVLLHCRKCERSAVVDRQDLETATTLLCPLPDCPYMWCKNCQQEVTVGGPQHTCDGSSELEHLMQQQGWKYCPSCKTPFQKSAGCNHMTCMSPGCNTHFCYRCGELIIRSALTRDVSTATTAHYNRCQMFA